MNYLLLLLLSFAPFQKGANETSCTGTFNLAAGQSVHLECRLLITGKLSAHIEADALSSIVSVTPSVDVYLCPEGTCARLATDFLILLWSPVTASGPVTLEPFRIENLGRSGFEDPPVDLDPDLPPMTPDSVQTTWADFEHTTVEIDIDNYDHPPDFAFFFLQTWLIEGGAASYDTEPSASNSQPASPFLFDVAALGTSAPNQGQSITFGVRAVDAAGNQSALAYSNPLYR